MVTGKPVLEVRLITEDTSSQAAPALAELVHQALRIIDPYVDRSRVEVTPPFDDKVASSASMWNGWNGDHRKRTALAKHIATRLAAGMVVVQHFDADVPWSVWSRTKTCERHDQFQKLLWPLIDMNLSMRIPEEAARKLALKRHVLWIPCGCIESWLFQSTRVVEDVCKQQHDDKAHRAELARWTADRTLLDEILSPGDEPLSCVGNRHNHALAEIFPADDVYLEDRSFTAAVDRLAVAPRLREQLAETCKPQTP